MSRGRHRHASPLRRLLPPMVGAALASACAGGAWFSHDPVVLRVLVAVAAAAAFTGAVLLRRWDRAAEREIAQLRRARLRDEWHADEKIAELESDLEEAREIRSRVESELGARRSELSRLRNEHASLLRRYANAESERAAALENARLALDPAPAPSPLTPALFLKAANVLGSLEEGAEREPEAAEASDAPGAQGERPTPDEPHERTAADVPQYPRGHVGQVATAVAVVPQSRQAAPRGSAGAAQESFDFFGARKELPAAAPRAVAELTSGADLADVVGEELVGKKALDEEGHGGPVGNADQAVIDLTQHDDTESINVRHLRALP